MKFAGIVPNYVIKCYATKKTSKKEIPERDTNNR